MTISHNPRRRWLSRAVKASSFIKVAVMAKLLVMFCGLDIGGIESFIGAPVEKAMKIDGSPHVDCQDNLVIAEEAQSPSVTHQHGSRATSCKDSRAQLQPVRAVLSAHFANEAAACWKELAAMKKARRGADRSSEVVADVRDAERLRMKRYLWAMRHMREGGKAVNLQSKEAISRIRQGFIENPFINEESRGKLLEVFEAAQRASVSVCKALAPREGSAQEKPVQSKADVAKMMWRAPLQASGKELPHQSKEMLDLLRDGSPDREATETR